MHTTLKTQDLHYSFIVLANVSTYALTYVYYVESAYHIIVGIIDKVLF